MPQIALAFGLLCSSAFADTITGTIVDSNGNPVPGVNISAKAESGGGDGNLMNGGTNAAGFFSSTIDPGTYRLTFEPPPPPAALGLVLEIDGLVVSGVSNLGTIMLLPAVAVSGHVVNGSGQPVAGVNLDVIDLATGDNIDTVADLTDPMGNFSIAVPVGQIELRMDPAPVLGPILAPHHLFFDTLSNVNLGNIQLKPGFLVTAALLDPTFAGIQNLDADVIDLSNGETLYTPGDNTDVNGLVDFVVPAGTYDIEFCPPPTSNFVAHLAKDVNVTATTNMGIIFMTLGFRLTGNVTSHLGPALSKVNIDVRYSSTQSSVLVCGDNTDALGNYSVVVPSGTFDLQYVPAFSLELGSRFLRNVTITGNTVRNPVLPFCSFGSPTGQGSAGSGGLVPTIASTGGSLRLGNKNWGFDISNGLGSAFGVVSLGLNTSCNSRDSGGSVGGLGGPAIGTSRALQRILFQLNGAPGVAGAGQVHFDFPIPNVVSLAGLYFVIDSQIFDPMASRGRAKTALLCGQLCQ